MMRNAMMAVVLKRNDSSPEAERNNARIVPATTTSVPRKASRNRHRFRTLRMTSINRSRGSIQPSLLTANRLQELLFPRQTIRDDRFDREQAEPRQQQVPPQALAPL